MSFELWLTLIEKVIQMWQSVDFHVPSDPVVAAKIRAAKTPEELHAAISEMRAKVTAK